MHRLFIRYTQGFSGDRKFVTRSGSSVPLLTCLGLTDRLVLPPDQVRVGRSIRSIGYSVRVGGQFHRGGGTLYARVYCPWGTIYCPGDIIP